MGGEPTERDGEGGSRALLTVRFKNITRSLQRFEIVKMSRKSVNHYFITKMILFNLHKKTGSIKAAESAF